MGRARRGPESGGDPLNGARWTAGLTEADERDRNPWNLPRAPRAAPSKPLETPYESGESHDSVEGASEDG